MSYYHTLEREGRALILDMLRMLEHDGYLSKAPGGYRFVSGLIEDWWREQNGDHFRPIADRISPSGA